MSEFRIPTMFKRVNLINLAIDGSFEDALNNWNCWLAEPTDTSQAKDGSHSLKLGGDAFASSKSAIQLIAGHKYYGREYIKTAGELTAADCRFELCGAVNGVEKSFVFGWNRGNYPDWTIISGVITVDGTYTEGFGLRTFTVGGSCNAWVDSIVIIDLTAACGAGNEPSKEWCDVNIPYFSGSYAVDISVISPIQALVNGLTIPEGVVTQITDASGRVIWAVKSGELVTGTLILRPSADISVEHNLYPADSGAAFLLINEEENDGNATYIVSPPLVSTEILVTSKFKLSPASEMSVKSFVITGVNIIGYSYCSSSTVSPRNTLNLEINGVEMQQSVATTGKNDFDVAFPDAIEAINNYVATHKMLPEINITITSITWDSSNGGNKASPTRSGISQIYVALGYEGY